MDCVNFLVFIARQQCSEDFQGGVVVKNPHANEGDTGDVGSIPGLERSSGVGNGNPLQFSCLKKSHGQRNLAGYSPWGHRALDMTEHAHTHTHTPIFLRGFCYLPVHKRSWQFNFVAR